MAAEVAVKRSNVLVSISPFPQKTPGLLAPEGSYFWPMGKATQKIVSAEDADLLEAEASRTVMNERSKKTEQRARYAFVRIADTEKPTEERLKGWRGVAKVPPLEVPHEKLIQALVDSVTSNQEVIRNIPAMIEKLGAKGAPGKGATT